MFGDMERPRDLFCCVLCAFASRPIAPTSRTCRAKRRCRPAVCREEPVGRHCLPSRKNSMLRGACKPGLGMDCRAARGFCVCWSGLRMHRRAARVEVCRAGVRVATPVLQGLGCPRVRVSAGRPSAPPTPTCAAVSPRCALSPAGRRARGAPVQYWGRCARARTAGALMRRSRAPCWQRRAGCRRWRGGWGWTLRSALSGWTSAAQS